MHPWSASFRKQIRHRPNFRYTARGRPQSMQRCTFRVENFGGLFAAAIFDLLAMSPSNSGRRATQVLMSPGVHRAGRYAAAPPSSSFFSGTPIARRSCLASSSVRAEVTIVMFIPCGRVNLSGLISGNTICSDRPRL